MFKTNITSPTPAQRRADLDKDDLELAERAEALQSEWRELRSPSKRNAPGTAPRIAEISAVLAEISAARELLAEQRKAILKEEEAEMHASLQGAVDADYRKLAPALSQVLASLKAIEAIEEKLKSRGFATAPVSPVDTSDIVISDLVDVLRQLTAKGYSR